MASNTVFIIRHKETQARYESARKSVWDTLSGANTAFRSIPETVTSLPTEALSEYNELISNAQYSDASKYWIANAVSEPCRVNYEVVECSITPLA